MPNLIDADARSELALARAVLYRIAGLAFRHPGAEWREQWMSAADGAREAALACRELDGSPAELAGAVEAALSCRLPIDEITAEHARVIGHTPRASTTPYETEWSGAAGELLQFHQLSDISAFYNAFCLELGSRCDERADHISIELEFMHFLAVKEAWAEEQRLHDLAGLCRDTARKFLSEHLARWAPGFCNRVGLASRGGFYARAAALLRAFLEDECRRLGAAEGDAALAPGATSFRPEDACFGCGHAAACLVDLKGAAGDQEAVDAHP